MASSYLWTCRSTCTGEGGGGVVKYGNVAIISGSRALKGGEITFLKHVFRGFQLCC